MAEAEKKMAPDSTCMQHDKRNCPAELMQEQNSYEYTAVRMLYALLIVAGMGFEECSDRSLYGARRQGFRETAAAVLFDTEAAVVSGL